MNPRPSEVWTFKSRIAPKDEIKKKHHLCIGEDAIFLFVSTHRERKKKHRGVMVIPNSAVPFLPPTETRLSEISCTTIIQRETNDLSVPRDNPRGKVARDLMKDLLWHVKNSMQLTEDERDAILDAIYDFYGDSLN